MSFYASTMPTREEVYEKFGVTAEAAQLFETELGTIVLALEGMKRGWHLDPDPATTAEFYEKLNKKTLGQVLSDVRRYVGLDDHIDASFTNALADRNRLNHGFFEQHGFRIFDDSGRETMVADLERIHTTLAAAYDIAQPIASMLVERLRVESNQERR